MGGAVAAVTKPIAKVVDKVVGSPDRSGGFVSANPNVDKAVSRASRFDEELAARRRGARARGRMLMSDARLNPEGGTETLGGGGQSLG